MDPVEEAQKLKEQLFGMFSLEGSEKNKLSSNVSELTPRPESPPFGLGPAPPDTFNIKWDHFERFRDIFLLRTACNRMQLIGFSDDSSKSYTTALYIWVSTLEGKINCHLQNSKSKIASSKYHIY